MSGSQSVAPGKETSQKNFLEIQVLEPYPRPTLTRNPGVGPRNPYFNMPSVRF